MSDREKPPGRKSSSAMRAMPGQERPSSPRGRRAFAPTEEMQLPVKRPDAPAPQAQPPRTQPQPPVMIARVGESAGTHIARIAALEAELARQARERDIEAEEHGALMARLMAVEDKLRRAERDRDARDAEIAAVRAELEASRLAAQAARRHSVRPTLAATPATIPPTAVASREALQAMLADAGTARVATLIAEMQQRDDELYTLRARAYGAALDMVNRLENRATAASKPVVSTRGTEALTAPPPGRKPVRRDDNGSTPTLMGAIQEPSQPLGRQTAHGNPTPFDDLDAALDNAIETARGRRPQK